MHRLTGIIVDTVGMAFHLLENQRGIYATYHRCFFLIDFFSRGDSMGLRISMCSHRPHHFPYYCTRHLDSALRMCNELGREMENHWRGRMLYCGSRVHELAAMGWK